MRVRHCVGDDVSDVCVSQRVLGFTASASDLDKACSPQGAEVL